MASVSDFSIDPFLESAIKRIEGEAKVGAALLGISKSILDNPEVYTKISDSYSGLAVDVQIDAVFDQLQLWVSRAWEENGYSLPRFGMSLQRDLLDIAHVRCLAHPNWTNKDLGVKELPSKVTRFVNKVTDIATSSICARLKVRRDEVFAHSLPIGKAGSRKRLRELNISHDGYSWNELISLCDQTLELFSEALLLVKFSSHDFESSAKNWEEHGKLFWRLLPKLAELEETQWRTINKKI